MKEVTGQRIVAERIGFEKIGSSYLRMLDLRLRSEETPCHVSLLARVDDVHKASMGKLLQDAELEAKVLEDMIRPVATRGPNFGRLVHELHHVVAVKLAVLLQKERAAAQVGVVSGGGESKKGVDLLRAAARRANTEGEAFSGPSGPSERPDGPDGL